MKTTFIALSLFLLISFPLFSQVYDDWELQNPYPTSNLLSDMSFVNDSTGWIVGEKGTIIKTTDGGETWEIQESGTDYWLMNVAFVDEQTGFASGNNSFVIYTTDGGEHWERMPGFQWYADPLKSIYVVNPDTVWFGSWNGQIYGCFNYGQEWIRIPPNGDYLEINSIQFPDKMNGWAAGGSYGSNTPFFKKSNDYGQTWTKVQNDSLGNILDMIFSDSVTGYLISSKYSFPDMLWKTTDKGDSWHVKHTFSNDWFKLFFLDNNTGYSLNYNQINKTVDGGNNWEQHSFYFGIIFTPQNLFFVNDSTGYLCDYNGMVAKTEDSGNSWEIKTKGYYETIYSLSFPDEENGWAISQTRLLHTDNGGGRWNDVAPMPLSGGRNVTFYNKNNGWFTDNYGISLYHTVNGGQSWDAIGAVATTYISKLYFTDSLTGWYCTVSGDISRTEDAGYHWTEVDKPHIDGLMVKDLVTDGNKIWILCNNDILSEALLYFSEDNGINWELYYNDFGIDNIYRILRTDDGTMFVSGENNKIFKSVDNGHNWNLIYQYTGSGIMNVFAVNSLEIYAVTSRGKLVYSHDGGTTWHESESGCRGLKDLCFFEDQGWVAGESGAIAHVNTLTLNTADDRTVRRDAALIYPNPGGNYLNVETGLKGAYLVLFSLNGNKVITEKLNSGKTVVNTAILPEGIYFYEIMSKENIPVQTGKWVKGYR